jgi:hypothetical protein
MMYKVSQDGRSIFWELIVSAILKKKWICTCVLFRTVSEIEIFHCTVSKLLIRKILRMVSNTGVYCQVTKLVQFTWYNTFSKIPPSTSMHFVARVRTWRVARLYSVLYSEIALSRKQFGIGHMYMYTYTFLLRMAYDMTSQNTDISALDNLYILWRFPNYFSKLLISQLIR